MSEVDTQEKAVKAKAEVEQVLMEDGRSVAFAGKRLMVKSSAVKGGALTTTFDFRNGAVREFSIPLDDQMIAVLAGHGAEQKIGDETAGVKAADGSPDIESMVLAVESIIERLSGSGSIEDRWYAVRAAGDGFSGAHVVIRAIMEAAAGRGKPMSQDEVKAYLAKKLEAGKAGGLTRQALYAAFRAPDTVTGPIIERLEREKAKPKAAIDANAALEDMFA